MNTPDLLAPLWKVVIAFGAVLFVLLFIIGCYLAIITLLCIVCNPWLEESMYRKRARIEHGLRKRQEQDAMV